MVPSPELSKRGSTGSRPPAGSLCRPGHNPAALSFLGEACLIGAPSWEGWKQQLPPAGHTLEHGVGFQPQFGSCHCDPKKWLLAFYVLAFEPLVVVGNKTHLSYTG